MLWLGENLSTILVGLLVAAIVILPLALPRIRSKKAPAGTCKSGCGGCPYSGRCHRG